MQSSVGSSPSSVLRGVITAIDAATAEDDPARVAAALRSAMPRASDLLTATQLAGDPHGYQQYVLHVASDGTYSVVALVWRPGQQTPVHDHVSWCVVAVLQGAETEQRFTQDARGNLVATSSHLNPTGTVCALQPPGDIHRVRNAGNGIAVSLHVYGADVNKLGSSIRRTYELSETK